MDENECSGAILGAAIEVHRLLGPGLLESAYEEVLAHEFGLRGLQFLRQLSVPVRYKDLVLPDAYRLDFLVNDLVIVEIKSIERLTPMHTLQLHTYLKFSNKRLGLLLNFNTKVLHGGVRRVVHNLRAE